MADDTKYETTLPVEEDENSELSGVTDEKSGRQDYGLVVSENGERPVAVQIEDVDQDHYEGQSGEEILTSKCTQNKKISEEQEEIVRDEDDGTESSEGDSDSDSDDSDDSDSDDFWAWFFWGEDGGEEKQEETDREESLFKTIENDDFPIVQGKLTAKSIMSCGRNPLLVAIKVTEKLHARAKKKEPEKAGFEDLANRVEEFTLRFMDPLKYDSDQREAFSKHSGTQVILETAIKLKQKKFFDHPIILELMTAMWYGGNDNLKSLSSWWLLLNIWCLFEVVLFPISFFAAFVLDLCCPITDIYSRYKDFFSIPYFTFVRDMASYLVLLGVHLVICFEPSQLSFSGLEWAILMFFLGRLLMEFHQVANKRTRRKYLSDRWNFFDIAMLVFYFCVILPMRIATWTDSESVSNNRTLQIAECFYGFNAMLLVFRAFGSILETIKGVGTIQIALSHIIRDAGVVVLHFAAITLAFSSTITKIFVSEVSFRKGNTTEEDSMCSDAGMRCVEHVMVCKLGGFVIQRHNELRDLEAELFSIYGV